MRDISFICDSVFCVCVHVCVYVCVIQYPNTLQHKAQHTWEGIACPSICMPGEREVVCVCVCVCARARANVCNHCQSTNVRKRHLAWGRLGRV